MKLELPNSYGAVLEVRKPRGSRNYLPVRIRFANGLTTKNWEDELWNLGLQVTDWENPRIIDKPEL